jgi:hypothetical protein
MASTAQYVAQPIVDVGQVSTANTNRDGTGALVTIASGPSTASGSGVGKRVTRVSIARSGASTATVVCFYYSPDNGTTNRLIAEVAVPAYSVSTTTAQVIVEVPSLIGFVIPGAATNAPCIRASTQTSQTTTPLNVTIESGLF